MGLLRQECGLTVARVRLPHFVDLGSNFALGRVYRFLVSSVFCRTKLLGVCIHPKYGGWFAFRGVFIFSDVLVPDLEQRQPADVVQCEDVRRDLLRLFNFSWQNGRYRDVINVDERYSARQQEYFRTVPSERWELIEQWRNEARTRSWSGVGR
ncbi:hypothetical protein HPB47_013867 [Ixodes persulcatus]|uniref:Uncharacterized protein n=1 Tax=Ixodes persulcatus TaxID=34615 RepID=A0AC60R159_IXOPE|nr:hypothetical protein HPB47_013867 [Ixodes persulcatus]